VDLPEGFSYRVISRSGAIMDDGFRVPQAHDGMAAFDAGEGKVALICNHELNFNHGKAGPGVPDGKRVPLDRAYDAGHGSPLPGGTTTLVYDPAAQRVQNHFLSLAGTERNCAGGPTPWGSWLSCEESVSTPDRNHERSHGWVFEVPSTARGLVDPVPLTALGRFNHEAVAVDPRTGIAYLTEDQDDSLLYRFIPNEKGRFAAGGKLQALVLADWPGADTRNYSPGKRRFPERTPAPVRWIDLDHVDAPEDDLRQRGHAAGAALFARGEGICLGPDGIYFACTDGGAIEAGQVFRYRPAVNEGGSEDGGTLELFVESKDPRQLENCDNLVATPWGDLLACEDANQPCALVGITPAGVLYTFAENNYSGSELAGACFAPDGRTLFVNLQSPGLTLAITGPFPA
jgi:secreted PhoX family phosphatase